MTPRRPIPPFKKPRRKSDKGTRIPPSRGKRRYLGRPDLADAGFLGQGADAADEAEGVAELLPAGLEDRALGRRHELGHVVRPSGAVVVPRHGGGTDAAAPLATAAGPERTVPSEGGAEKGRSSRMGRGAEGHPEKERGVRRRGPSRRPQRSRRARDQRGDPFVFVPPLAGVCFFFPSFLFLSFFRLTGSDASQLKALSCGSESENILPLVI